MNNSTSIIAHLDLDSFFVSVECLNDPSLKGKAVIVGGDNDRGVVAACSYEARRFGVHSAMPMRTAMKLCPHASVVSGTRSAYTKYSNMVTDIINSKAPLFEKASIDEFYLDLMGMEKYFNPFDWTYNLRKEIMDETKLPISFGISINKMIAKMATNEAKPNGYLQVPFGKEMEFLAPLKIAKIPGVGEQAQQILKYHKLDIIADIQQHTSEQIEEKLGKWGIELWQKCQGLSSARVEPYHESKSISTENTFNENTSDMTFIMSEIVRMVERVCFQLRQECKLTGCMTVKLRYPDFETYSKQTTISATASDDHLIPVAKDLFHKLYKKGNAVRLLGIRLSDLSNNALQTNLFSDVQKKSELYKAIDNVKTRFGKSSVARAAGRRKG